MAKIAKKEELDVFNLQKSAERRFAANLS